MAQKRKVVVVMSQNVQDEDQVSQILDQTAQSLQKLAKNLAESSQSQPRNLRSRKKKEDLEVIDEVEAKKPKLEESGKEKEETEDSCPICYDKPLHPVTLPCGHVYCFLCGKGLVESGTSQCAMCRSVIPRDFFKHPNTSVEVKEEGQDFFWYYQGRNGWWRFDERNNKDLEDSFQDKKEKVHFLICGHLYVIDFKKMVSVEKSGKLINFQSSYAINLASFFLFFQDSIFNNCIVL